MTLTRSLVRGAALSAAVLLATTVTATADIPGDGALPDDAVPAERYEGDDRYATAGLTALATYPDGAPTAIIARGDDFPDGLAASFLAGVEDAPILLTQPSSLPLFTQDALQQLGTQRAIIIGGPAAIDQSVQDRLVELLGEGNVDRASGQDRFQTAAFVFDRVGEFGTLADVSGASDQQLTTAIVASGRNFPDALSAGPLAHAAGVPILLTEPDRLPDITRFTLERGVEQVLVAGGPVTIDEGVVARLRGIDGVQVVERVSGPDRTATAAEFAALAREQLGWPAEAATVSLGTDFPDALSLAPAASRMQAPILLTRSTSEVGPATFASLQDTCQTLADVVIAGGDVAVDASAERQAELATSCADHAFPMDPDQVVGGGDAQAAGAGWIWTESLCYAARVQDLSSPALAAHVHSGDAGQNGPIVATLDTPSPTTGDGLSIGCLTDEDVEEGTAAELRTALQEDPSGFYVQVHSEDHPNGAVRGQVAQAPDGGA